MGQERLSGFGAVSSTRRVSKRCWLRFDKARCSRRESMEARRLLYGGVLLWSSFSPSYLPAQRTPEKTSRNDSEASIISGVVLDRTTAAPIAGAMVSATLLKLTRERRQVESDERGRFTFRLPGGGPYEVFAAKEGYSSGNSLVFGRDAQRRLVSLASGGAGTVKLQLAKGGVIAGRITDEEGNPLPRVTVIAYVRT